ncbi:MAG: hypothetical protein DSY79_00520 [Chloroflexi bacterium]|jgi:transcriptional regulator with XRE-family HTH domain|nr:MAG: hypothetical protein DSY79_00520 [Chloroflexota bacterium]
MIKNQRQYRITKAQAEKFAIALDGISEGPDEIPEVHPLIRKAQKDALRYQLSELREQLEEYDALQSGSYTIPDLRTIEELPRTLIQTRIGRGLSQKALGELIGVKEQQIQRYEATDYSSASLSRVMEVIAALRLETNSVVIPENSGLPGEKNVFISFASEDLDEVNHLRAEAVSEDNDWEFSDRVLQEPFEGARAEYIKRGIRERIRQASVTLVYVSANTAASGWVDWEIRESIMLGKGVIAMHSGDVPPQNLPSAITEFGFRVIPWRYSQLISAIDEAAANR